MPEQPNLTKMKRSALLNLFIFAIVLSIGAIGCSRGPKSLTPIPGSGSAGGSGPGYDDVSPVGQDDVMGEGLAQSNMGRTKVDEGVPDPDFFSNETVYFEFDSSAVNPNDIGKIQAVADYLAANQTHSVIIEGHCDERGTEEYNRALGERRALAVREILVNNMGASSDAVFTLSFGEDVPAVDGNTEEAYRLNRRGEFVLLRPKN